MLGNEKLVHGVDTWNNNTFIRDSWKREINNMVLRRNDIVCFSLYIRANVLHGIAFFAALVPV